MVYCVDFDRPITQHRAYAHAMSWSLCVYTRVRLPVPPSPHKLSTNMYNLSTVFDNLNGKYQKTRIQQRGCAHRLACIYACVYICMCVCVWLQRWSLPDNKSTNGTWECEWCFEVCLAFGFVACLIAWPSLMAQPTYCRKTWSRTNSVATALAPAQVLPSVRWWGRTHGRVHTRVITYVHTTWFNGMS